MVNLTVKDFPFFNGSVFPEIICEQVPHFGSLYFVSIKIKIWVLLNNFKDSLVDVVFLFYFTHTHTHAHTHINTY